MVTSDNIKQIAARALALLDLTDLSETCTNDDIDALCERAFTPHGPVAAICIWPQFITHARACLDGRALRIATVVNFPSGNQSVDQVIAQTQKAINDGADEIDLVLPYRALLDGDEQSAADMVQAISTVTGGKILLKVIIETGELETDEWIDRASSLAIEQGADFIKTSTGKVAVNATPHFAEKMIDVIHKSGKRVGFKPAGGIKTAEDCGEYLAIADRIMGPEWASPQTFRFGASSVLADLLARLDDATPVSDTGGY